MFKVRGLQKLLVRPRKDFLVLIATTTTEIWSYSTNSSDRNRESQT